MATKVMTALQLAKRAPALAIEIVTVFSVSYYAVEYRKNRTQCNVTIVVSPRVVDAALRSLQSGGGHEAHASKSTLCRQINDAIQQSGEHEKFTHLEPRMMSSLLSQDDPAKDHLKVQKLARRATFRDHVRYALLGLLGRQDALLAPEVR